MKTILFFFSVILLSTISFEKEKIIPAKYKNETKVIKFMYSEEYLMDYGEKMFWDNTQEHAIMFQDRFEIKNLVQKLPQSNSKLFKNHNYCFIIPNSKVNDTVYADFSLKAWIIKKDGKSIYYYDKEGNLARDLRANYSFFRECW
ncbi:hypothetical protein K0U91_13140 [Chryseobacterium chendengshani]|uniref:hypothetical protein n=1 Tax=Chryseobacterium sp. LJ668 TaxID=2864040 RepID=UPI001C68DEA5|nr:hypothetical protein [Chryseobacterium sp. LJ668]MBW8522451.1 hypothetical protein [Chryseobacterium sp. LJ668]QYK15994.1 hypothetical protein K0U91_13140 [Chryseobacterium sp. LJ668]